MYFELYFELQITATETHKMLQTGLRGTPYGKKIFEQFSQLIFWPKMVHRGKNVGKVYEIINED